MDNYETYLRHYANKHGITIEEAETHATVKNVKEYYEQKDQVPIKLAGWSEREDSR